MGITLSLLAMLGFAANILLTRYAMPGLSVEAGFLVVLTVNILFPAALFGFEFALVGAWLLAGLVTVAGFGFGSVLRGLATRNWPVVAAQLRADRTALWLYIGCGVSTSLGAIFMSLAMKHMEIALSVLVVHTTPLVIFPVSVFILKNREEISPRTLLGALMVLAGIGLLAFR